VLLLEKERFPRHQIGESLLPSTVHGICRLIGADRPLHQAGFLRKRGGTFQWGRSSTPWTFAFSERPESPTGYAFQVERARFDKILLDNAARLGVTVREECSVDEILFDGDTVAGVRYQDAAGGVHTAEALFVADAGGHQSPFHRLVGRRLYSKFFQNVALYAYFRHGKRLPPPNSGNILCSAFSGGWFWYIPLSADLTSVGAVVSKETAAEALRGSREEAFNRFVASCPLIAEYLQGASRVTEGMYGQYRVRSDYSYCNTAFHQRRLLLVGDAACFVDPVLSSGVHLATYAALLAARSINTCLSAGTSASDRPTERDCFDEFEQRYRREFGKFYEFLAAFYDMHHDHTSYYWRARKVLQSTAKPHQAFVTLVAGLSQPDEPVFAGTACLADPSHSGLGDWLYGLIEKRRAPGAAAATDAAPEIQGLDFDSFIPGLSTEMSQIQSQALLGARRPGEVPMTQGRLIASSDGLSWVRSTMPEVLLPMA
jgi:halogenation protein CepH